jgi:ribosome maturation factor RimP
MIKHKDIERLIDLNLREKDLFLVELKISSNNHIEIYIDSETSDVSIDDCVALSRFIETHLDRDIEDFDLNVSSAGLDMPLKINKQYPKHIGEQFKIQTTDDDHLLLLLKEVSSEGISGIPLKKNKNAKKGSKKPYIELDEISIPFQKIREAKINVVF